MPGIDKVRLDNSYQQYQQRVPVRRTDETKPQFPFDPDEKGVVYEHSEPQKTEAVRTVEAESVTKTTAAEPGDPAAPETVTGWLAGLGRRFLSFLRGIWDVVWNGPDQTTGRSDAEEQSAEMQPDAARMEQPGAADEMAALSGEMRAEQLQQIIADHDMEQLVQFVTEGGTKKPARSTDLLTIYNRYGRVNYIDPSDRKKILEGNFNDIKL